MKLNKIEHEGRVFYYDGRCHEHITTGTIQDGDLLIYSTYGDNLSCYPAFWDDIDRPVAQFAAGVLRPKKHTPPKQSWATRFINMIDAVSPTSEHPLCFLAGVAAFGALLAVIGFLIMSL